MGPTLCRGKRGAPFRSYNADKQNNTPSIRSSVSVQNGYNGIYRKATKLIRLEKLDSDSGLDIAGPLVMGAEDLTSTLLGAYSRGMCSHPNTSDAWCLVTTGAGCGKEIRGTDYAVWIRRLHLAPKNRLALASPRQ
jgi:hypothetical protein